MQAFVISEYDMATETPSTTTVITALPGCHSDPCQNNGTCNDDGERYQCRCLHDLTSYYTGVNCETGESS